MVEFTLWGLGGMVLIAALVEVIKLCFPKLQDRAVIAVSVGLGIFLSWIAQIANVYPVAGTAINVTGAGLLAGLAACGFFSGVKKRV